MFLQFVGRFIAKAIRECRLLACYFTRAMYKHILNKPVGFNDMEAQDQAFYESLRYMLEHPLADIDYEQTFSTLIDEFGVVTRRELKACNIPHATFSQNALLTAWRQ